MEGFSIYNNARKKHGFPPVTLEEYYKKFPMKRPGALQAKVDADAKKFAADVADLEANFDMEEAKEIIKGWKKPDPTDPKTGLPWGAERVVVDGQEYMLNLGQLSGTEPLPPEILWKPYQTINADGTLSPYKRDHDSSLIRMAKENPELFAQQFGHIKSLPQLDELEDRFIELLDRDRDDTAFEPLHGFIDRQRDSFTKDHSDLYYVDPDSDRYGERKPYGYNPHEGHNLLNPDTRLWERFPEPRKGGSFEPSGYSYYQDKDALQSDLDVFGPIHPKEDQGKSQTSLNQYLVDQMGDLPEQLDTVYNVAPAQPEPAPIPQQQLVGMAGGGMQSPPPGMVTGQPQQPDPPQFDPADVQYGNNGEAPPERPREENEWGYFYE